MAERVLDDPGNRDRSYPTSIRAYNNSMEQKGNSESFLPYIVFIIDEFEPLMNGFRTEFEFWINGYEALLRTLTSLKLSEMEKDHIKEVQTRQRKAAITSVFGSFGSILTGVSSVQLAYVALNAALNYAKAVSDANAAASEDALSSVPVVLWAINKECEDTLDREGSKKDYYGDKSRTGYNII